MDREGELAINKRASKDTNEQKDEKLESKRRKITKNAIEQRLRGPTIKTYPSSSSKDIHLSHPLVLDMPELSFEFPSQNDSHKTSSSTSSREAWKRKLGKFAMATPESEPDYMWLPFFGTFLAFTPCTKF